MYEVTTSPNGKIAVITYNGKLVGVTTPVGAKYYLRAMKDENPFGTDGSLLWEIGGPCGAREAWL